MTDDSSPTELDFRFLLQVFNYNGAVLPTAAAVVKVGLSPDKASIYLCLLPPLPAFDFGFKFSMI